MGLKVENYGPAAKMDDNYRLPTMREMAAEVKAEGPANWEAIKGFTYAQCGDTMIVAFNRAGTVEVYDCLIRRKGVL